MEYHLPNIVQTQVEEAIGYSFSAGLRSILRQDPDIIMVGEIRDLETAKTAINSALTGHLVLSTLHTNNAAGTIPRLIDPWSQSDQHRSGREYSLWLKGWSESSATNAKKNSRPRNRSRLS